MKSLVYKLFLKSILREMKPFLIISTIFYAFIIVLPAFSPSEAKEVVHQELPIRSPRILMCSLMVISLMLLDWAKYGSSMGTSRRPSGAILTIDDVYSLYVAPLSDAEILKVLFVRSFMLSIVFSIGETGYLSPFLRLFLTSEVLSREGFSLAMMRLFLTVFIFLLMLDFLLSILMLHDRRSPYSLIHKVFGTILRTVVYASAVASSMILFCMYVIYNYDRQLALSTSRMVMSMAPLLLVFIGVSLLLKYNGVYEGYLPLIVSYTIMLLFIMVYPIFKSIREGRLYSFPLDEFKMTVEAEVEPVSVRRLLDIVVAKIRPRSLIVSVMISGTLCLCVHVVMEFLRSLGLLHMMIFSHDAIGLVSGVLFGLFIPLVSLAYNRGLSEGATFWVYRTSPCDLRRLVLLLVLPYMLKDGLIIMLPLMVLLYHLVNDFNILALFIVTLIILEVQAFALGIIQGSRSSIEYTSSLHRLSTSRGLVGTYADTFVYVKPMSMLTYVVCSASSVGAGMVALMGLSLSAMGNSLLSLIGIGLMMSSMTFALVVTMIVLYMVESYTAY
mgnify:CR=1 FL=1